MIKHEIIIKTAVRLMLRPLSSQGELTLDTTSVMFTREVTLDTNSPSLSYYIITNPNGFEYGNDFQRTKVNNGKSLVTISRTLCGRT